MEIIVLFFGFLLAFLTAGAMCGPPLADLLRRDDAVQWWYPLPLLICAVILAPIPVLFLGGELDWSVIEGLSGLLAFFHFALAGVCLWLGVSLAVVRGLRPGGPTSRKVRTTLVALVILVLLGVQPVLFTLIDDDYLVGISWLGIGSFAGILWLAVINRRGPYRLTEGRRWSAAFLIASFFQFGLCMAHVYWMITRGYPTDGAMFTPLVWGLVTAVSLTLAGGLRFLAGPLPWQPLVGSAALSPTLFGPLVLLTIWRPVPAGTPLPTWTTLSGRTGHDKGIERYLRCVQVHDQPVDPCRSWEQRFYAAPPDLPLSEVPSDVYLLAGSGRISTASGRGWQAEVTLRADGDHALATFLAPGASTYPNRGEAVRLAVGPELEAWLQRFAQHEGLLSVERNPAWTVQDYVSMCASWPWRCELLPQ